MLCFHQEMSMFLISIWILVSKVPTPTIQPSHTLQWQPQDLTLFLKDGRWILLARRAVRCLGREETKFSCISIETWKSDIQGNTNPCFWAKSQVVCVCLSFFKVSNSQTVITQICTYVFEASGVRGQSFFSHLWLKHRELEPVHTDKNTDRNATTLGGKQLLSPGPDYILPPCLLLPQFSH